MVGTKDFEKRTVLKIFGMNCFTRQLHCYIALAAKPTLNVHCIAYRRVALVNACPTSTALAIIFVSLLGNLTALRAASSKFNESPVLSPSVQSFDSMSQWGGQLYFEIISRCLLLSTATDALGTTSTTTMTRACADAS